MKKIIFALMCATLCFSSFIGAVDGERFLQSEEAVKSATYGHIDARGLKALIDSQTPFVLLDARGDKWNDGNIIPGAMLASYEYSAEQLAQIVPNKEALVVVYCFSFKPDLPPKSCNSPI